MLYFRKLQRNRMLIETVFIFKRTADAETNCVFIGKIFSS